MSAPIWFDSTETGAPVLNNAAGSLVALLRAALVNGFNVKAITSIVVASGVATVTCPAHGYSSTYGKWLKITGASVAALNGTKQQTVVDANTFTYLAPGVADGTYTATDARRAPLGWAEAFTNGGGTVSIFSRTATESTAQMLRVDDRATDPTDARVMCVESATGVDTYSGVSPTLSGGFYWYKGANNATAKRWKLVGDGRLFYLFVDLSTFSHFRYMVFGDIDSFKAADAYNTVISGELTFNSGAGNQGFLVPTNPGSIAANEYLTLARGAAQTGVVVRAGVHAVGTSLAGSTGPVFPSPVDGGCVIVAPFFVNENNSGSGYPIRGPLPGLAAPLSLRPFTDNQVVSDIVGSDHKFLAVSLIASSGGQLLVDLTEWR